MSAIEGDVTDLETAVGLTAEGVEDILVRQRRAFIADGPPETPA
jgi:hypothetical protein